MSWIKFDCSTPEKPEVLAITVALGWDDPDLTVGKLLKVWRWFDQHSTEGNARNVTSALLDRIIGVTGITQAMVNCGWMIVTEDGLQLPSFEVHNGKTAKDRLLTAKRVSKTRGEKPATAQQNSECNGASVTSPLAREEKNREEKNIKNLDSKSIAPEKIDRSPIIKPVGVDDQVWQDWLTHRKKKKASVTPTVLKQFAEQAQKAGLSVEQAFVHCCARGWVGFEAEWLKNDLKASTQLPDRFEKIRQWADAGKTTRLANEPVTFDMEQS
jgi:hypothetical protein